MSIESRRHQYGTVFGHWQIGELLGASKNGQTAVFHLQHKESRNEESAVKVITLIEERGKLSEFSPRRKAEYEAELEKRKTHALNEVQIMYALKGYTNIVSYEDRVTEQWTEDNSFGCDLLIRMELLCDLRKIIQTGHIFSETEIIKIGKDICNALILCHGEANPIIHRDIKPENIFVNARGDYKLGDFGISRILDGCRGTVATTAVGTPEYYAPEQVREGYDERVDIYSLGLVLYELSNQNRRPFAESAYDNGGKANLLRLSGTKFPLPCDASADFAKVILKACAFKANDRYRTAKEMLEALEQLSIASHPRTSKITPNSTGSSPRSYETVPAATTQNNREAFGTLPATPNFSGSSKEDKDKRSSDITGEITDLETRADSGDARALNILGNNYYYGRGVAVDYTKAFQFFQKAANLGDAHGQYNLGCCYWFGKGVKKDYVQAFKIFQAAAEKGNASAIYGLGACYDNGQGVDTDKKKAALLFYQSAQKGNVSAKKALDHVKPRENLYIAECLYHGRGIEKNLSEAILFFQKAAEAGLPYAEYALGFCYENAHGVEKDPFKAFSWYERAAQHAHTESMRCLADCYLYGFGVNEDAGVAVEWYIKAADSGNAVALRQLGVCYEKGLGVQPDLLRAMDYYRKAMDKADFEAANHYNRILSDASNEELANLNAHDHKFENISEEHAKELITRRIVRKIKNREVLFVFAVYALPIIALISGCVMWFMSVPLWINITILVTSGIISGSFMITIGEDLSSKLFSMMVGAIVFPLATTIVIALLEGILWVGNWIFELF